MNMFGSSNNTASGTGTNPVTNYNPLGSTPTSGEGKCECAAYQDTVTKQPCTPKKGLFGLWGGRKRSIKRGGSFSPNTDLGVASTASSFSGGRTAQPHNWTGGKRRRRSSKRRTRRLKCNKCSKRRRHRH